MKSLAKFQELGDKFRAGNTLNALGELMRERGDYRRAGEFYEANIEILRAHRSRGALAAPTSNLAWVSLHGGDHRQAKALFKESLKLYEEAGNRTGMTHCLSGFAGVLGLTGKPEQAARLFGAAESLFERIVWSRRMYLVDMKEFDHYIAAVRLQLDQAAFVKAWAEGRLMTMEQAIAYALEE